MDEIVLKRGAIRPSNTRKLRLLYMLLKLPIIHRIANRMLVRELKLPSSTSIAQGFYCSSELLYVGNNTGLGNTHIIAYAPVTIGKCCSLSFNNMIITSTHDFNDFSTVIAKPVTIGDNVWITSNVVILPEVTIGSNSVIGAGSVVTHDIPPGVFAAGNPCKVVKKVNFSIEK